MGSLKNFKFASTQFKYFEFIFECLQHRLRKLKKFHYLSSKDGNRLGVPFNRSHVAHSTWALVEEAKNWQTNNENFAAVIKRSQKRVSCRPEWKRRFSWVFFKSLKLEWWISLKVAHLRHDSTYIIARLIETGRMEWWIALFRWTFTWLRWRHLKWNLIQVFLPTSDNFPFSSIALLAAREFTLSVSVGSRRFKFFIRLTCFVFSPPQFSASSSMRNRCCALWQVSREEARERRH